MSKKKPSEIHNQNTTPALGVFVGGNVEVVDIESLYRQGLLDTLALATAILRYTKDEAIVSIEESDYVDAFVYDSEKFDVRRLEIDEKLIEALERNAERKIVIYDGYATNTIYILNKNWREVSE